MHRSRFMISLYLLLVLLDVSVTTRAAEVLDLGNRRELLVDDYLVESMKGTRWRLHMPVDRGMAFKTGEGAHEGPYTAYCTVIKDGDTYRMYYRGNPSLTAGTYCYAESPDGITWTKPNLGLHEYRGSRDNNIILQGAEGSHSFSPFLDTNPDVSPDQRFKALGLLRTTDNKRWELLAFVSADGIHWDTIRDEPVMTEGAFDSQNVAFWSEAEGKYVCYYRTKSGGQRQISRATSNDFIHWTEGTTMAYRRLGGEVPFEQMYVNQTSPYFRARHLYVATAARFMKGRQAATDEQVAAFGKGNFEDCSDAVLMTTRGDYHYDRTFMEGWVRPGIGVENWGSRSNYPVLGIVPTGDNEMSVYVVKAYGMRGVRVQRYSMRLDGLGSIHAPYDGGEMLTRPIRCPGGKLAINFSTSAAGSVTVELLDDQGNAIPGFTSQDCGEMIGDEIDRVISWGSKKNVEELKGRNIRIRFTLKDADLFALQFQADDE